MSCNEKQLLQLCWRPALKRSFLLTFQGVKKGEGGPLTFPKTSGEPSIWIGGKQQLEQLERTLQFAKMGIPYSTNRMKAPNNVQIPSGKLTWQWKNTSYTRKYIFKWSISRCYVHLPECNVSNLQLSTYSAISAHEINNLNSILPTKYVPPQKFKGFSRWLNPSSMNYP